MGLLPTTSMNERLVKLQLTYNRYVAWWLPIDVANGSCLAPMSYIGFCELLLTNDIFWMTWENGFTKRDLLNVIVFHYTEYGIANKFCKLEFEKMDTLYGTQMCT
jgi:hypothetical protein